MTDLTALSKIRRDYGKFSLTKEDACASPFKQFQLWFAEILSIEHQDPTAMVLSTVDAEGHPDSRVVLLKGFDDDGFIFYTNYESTKSEQIATNPHVALNFYWPQMTRQVRIRGKIVRVSEAQSDEYFASRPHSSQLSAIASPQSKEITNRTDLEAILNRLLQQHQNSPVPRPKHWGGYKVIPYEMEFFQGRDNRLHDRLQYCLQNKRWIIRCLAP
jgi:pyridoxamine 5'-phosphate oxidase